MEKGQIIRIMYSRSEIVFAVALVAVGTMIGICVLDLTRKALYDVNEFLEKTYI